VKRPAVIAALATAAVAVVVVVSSSDSSYRVTAVFDSVNGLVPGAEVDVAGLKVGSVDSISVGDDGLPHVTLEIDGDYQLHEGATADLRAGSASGQVNRFVELTSGAGPKLGDGATLGLAHTDQPVEVDRILSTLDPRTRERIGTALDGLARATAGRGPDMAATLRRSAAALGSTADLVGQIDADGEALRSLVADGRAVVSELAAGRGSLVGTAETMAALLRTTAGRQAELARSAELLPGALDSADGALTRLDQATPTLRELVSVARPGIAALAPFAEALRPTIEAARPALDRASRLAGAAGGQLARISPLLETAEPTLAVLRPALESAGPILDEARVRTPDFFSFFSNWADFTGVYDANGHAARVGLVLPPAPLNQIGPNDDGAGNLTAPFVRTPGVLEGDPWVNYRDSFLSGGDGS
jgi:phospholipid/cholesterol/gamma-HCH transport system substrate-binding protein